MEPVTLSPTVVDTGDYHRRAAAAGVVGRWSTANENLPWKPEPRSVAHHWSYGTLRPLAVEATRFVRGENGALRVLTLLNPGHPDHEAAAGNLYSGLQVLVPGEDMHSHRHSPTAIRFVHESEGGWTAVDGEKNYLDAGDVVLTPAMLWHEHGNDGTGEVVWQDCTDDPLVTVLAANHFELFPTRSHLAGAHDTGAAGVLRPSHGTHPAGALHYPWAKTRAQLARADVATRGWAELRLTDVTGRHDVSRTTAARFLAVAPHARTPSHQHTGAVVLIVAKGSPTVHVEDVAHAAAQGDTVAVPSWSRWRIDNPAEEDCVLFAYDETPLLRNTGLYRNAAQEEASP
ncbi:cupin domain-containing protein [Kutzneria viridogrisea]|uniref:Gentisate 1,2-dioxygenase n=1 Tax=Kutzneria viridogrisea TaxID=47990 RepID=A0ABR6B8N8_9PSEU|nr:gentisate 1,2-dioxygenase [Kutzneria viridogrisea]